ncbi:MAG TPA: helix-hairpin-helix domain-containing protein [Acidimicrobiia bacterium]|jgi:predicted flap endonuclease-1-like 5' DNA nuclease|nr:helix-hairpin-helix domain-containing protein [Acidimicrobiia bacterium]
MKRVAKVVGFLGAALAIIWAMRDRLISVTTSREPVPPSFRSPVLNPKDPSPPVTSIEGIGPVFAQRLTDAGISDVAALAGSSPDRVAEAASVSAARARSWIELANQFEH